MKNLQFISKTKDGLKEYHLAATEEKWLEKTIWKNKKDFYQTLLINSYADKTQYQHLLLNFGYNNNSYEENIFIYESLIWDLIKDKKIYVIINFRAATFLNDNELKYDKVDWEYQILHQINLDNNKTLFFDNGFVEAETGPIKPPTPRWNNKDEDKTALLEIRDLKTFLRVIASLIMDDFSSINLFCFSENQKEKLVSILQDEEEPELNEILDEGDLFINLFLGADEGYKDYILIKTKSDLSEKLNQITNKLNQAGKFYEEELDDIDSFEKFMSLIQNIFRLEV